nr:protein NDUFAF4 homolog isoform X2 [Megalopta genalis]
MCSYVTYKVMMGNFQTFVTRPIRAFNIENRTRRLLAKEKLTPAPQHASVGKQKELVDKMCPNFMEEHYKKNTQLDDRLKNIYVKSTDPMETEEAIKSIRPLPQERGIQEYDFSYYDSDNVPEGKCSLNQVLTFLKNHSDNPDVYTADKIAAEYKLDKDVVESILIHFQVPHLRVKTLQIDSNPIVELIEKE